MRIENGKIIIEVEPDDVHWLVSEWKADDEATKEVWRLWAELNDCDALEVVRDASCLDSGCDIDGKEPHKPWCDHAC